MKVTCKSLPKEFRDWLKSSGLEIGQTLGYRKLCYIHKWLIEEHNIYVDVWCNASGWGFNLDKTCGTSIYNFEYICDSSSGMYKTYERALDAGIEKALKIIKAE